MTTCTDEARCQDFPLCRCARRGFSLDDGDTGATFWPPLCPSEPQSDPHVGLGKGGDDSSPQTGAQRFHPGGMTGTGIVMVPAGTVFTHSPAVALEKERNELRAEVEWLREDRDIWKETNRINARSAAAAIIRAEAAEAEVARLLAECADRESERADLRDRVQKAEAEVERLRNALDQWRWFTSGLGFGDGVTEPQITPGELSDIVEEALSAQRDHFECPVICELCGETLAHAPCEQCNGSGCGPATALGAYSECEWCAGVGKVHPGCAERSYADLVARAERAEAKVARVEALADEWGDWPITATGQSADLLRTIRAALKGDT